MSFVARRGGGMVGGGAGGGREGGGRGCGGHGGHDDEARKALICSVGTKKRAARRWLIQGREPPMSLRDYAPGGRYFDHLPPVVHAQPPPPADPVYAHDDAEEVAFIAQAIAASEAAISDMLRRDAEEIEAQMAFFRAREEAERAAKRARVEDAVILDNDE